MTIFNSGTYLKSAVYRPTSVGDALEITSSITIPAGTGATGTPIATGDILNFCKIGENVNVEGLTLESSDLDSATGIVFNLGNTASATCFMSGSTFGQTGGEKILRSSDATAGDAFATTPYAVQTTVQTVFATVTTGATTNPLTDRTITLKLKLFYALAETELTGLSGVTSTNLLGTKVFTPSIVYTYNGSAP